MTFSVSSKEMAPRCAKACTALLWMLLFFVHEAVGQTTTVYTQQIANYYDVWTTGTAGTFNQGLYQVGMFANGPGTKQVVRWRKFRTDGSGTNTSDRALQVGDQVVITLSATRANGRIGFALLASPTTGSWANRESNYAISINLDGPAYNSGVWGNWYLRANGGSTSASTIGGLQNTYRNFTFTLTLTAPNRMNVVMTDGVTTSTFNDVLLNTSNPITDYSIYLDDDNDGGTNRNIFWGLALITNQHSVTNTGILNIGGSNSNYSISGVIPNGLVSNSSSTSFVNNLTKVGTGNITLAAANTYTGSTTVTAGTLTIGNVNAIAATSPIVLNGGTLAVGTMTSGAVINATTLDLDNSSTINLGAANPNYEINFANSSAVAWNLGANLTITNWTPASNRKIYFPTLTSLTSGQLGRINFDNYGIGAKLIFISALGKYELVPNFFYITEATGSGVFSDVLGSVWLNDDKPNLFNGTETVFVQPGFTLTQDETQTLLKVEVAGTLIMNGTNTITTVAAAEGGVSNTGTITMVNGSTITIGAGGTFTNSGTLNMVVGSTVNMNAGAIWTGNGTIGTNGIINFTNTGTITSTSTLPNVIIAGNVNFNTSTIGTSLEVRGGGAVTPSAPFYAPGSTLIYNVSGTYNRNTEWGSNAGQGYPGNVQVNTGTTLNLNVNPISATAFGIGGNLTVQSGATLNTGALATTSFTINGNTNIAGTFDATGMTGGVHDLFFIGNLSIGGILSLSNVNGNDLYLSGNWNRTGTFNANNRAVYLRGGNTTISATGGQSFPFLRIEKTAATNTITLNDAITITNEVSFIRGVVISNSTRLFIMANGSSVDATVGNNGSTSSFVSGPMQKIGHTGGSGSSAFTFPVGKIVAGVNHFRTIGIGTGGSTTDSYTAEFHRVNSYNVGSISAVAASNGLQRVSRCEYWDLTRTGANVPVTLSWTSQSPCNVGYVNEFASLRVVQFNASNQWGDTFGNNGTTGLLTPGAGTITWNGPTIFNKFTLGSVSLLLNPLPFTVLSFNGRSRNTDIELSFSVKGNDEQQQYIIERSADGRNFAPLSTIAARQNLTEADYTTLDEQPINGWNFYRLTAVDLTGTKKQSPIIRVWFGSRGGKPAVYPNPVQGSAIQLFTGGLPKGTYTVQLRAQDGKLLLSRTWVYDGIAPVYTIAAEGVLAAGMYWLSITAPHTPPVSIKVIK